MECFFSSNLFSGFIGAIIGAAISYFATMRSIKKSAELVFQNGIELLKRQELIKAVTEFRKPLELALSNLRDGKQTAGVVKGNMKTFRDAKDLFRNILRIYKPEKTSSFDRIWDEYTCKEKDVNPEEYFRCYVATKDSPEEEMNKKAQCRINAILNFVNEL